jgi:hypothetical protein
MEEAMCTLDWLSPDAPPVLLIEAADHRFSGKERKLDGRFLDAVAWIRARRR